MIPWHKRPSTAAKRSAIQSRYKKSEKGKAARRRYESTEKYWAVYLRYRNKPGVRSYYSLAEQSRKKMHHIQEQQI